MHFVRDGRGAPIRAVGTAYDPGLPGVLVAVKPGRTFANLCLLLAVAVSANRRCHLACQEIFFLSVPDSVPARRVPAAGNGSSSGVGHIAARPVGGNDPPNTVVGSQAGGQGAGRSGDPIYPNRLCVAPNRGPSDLPNAAAHPPAILGSNRVAGGNSVPERAG